MRMTGALFLPSPSRACSGLQSPVQGTPNSYIRHFCSSSSSLHSAFAAAKPVSFSLISKSVMAELPEESGKAARETMKRYSSTNLKRSGKGVSIMWFRNDLRILDNEALYRAWQSSEALLPVYCIDPRLFGTTHYFGFPKTGELRAQFLLECLADLRKNLQAKGLELVIKHGKPESILPLIAREVGAHTVYAQKETCDEELRVEKHVMKALNNVHQLPHSSAGELENRRINLELIWGTTMYHIDDLPFIPSRIPDVYTQFRKAVESSAAVKQCLRLPLHLGPLPERIEEQIGSFEAVPSMAELGLTFRGQNGLGTMKFVGGESAALVRVNEYFWLKDMLRVYKETRNGMLGADYSSKFSPWLAFGCLSARLIHEEVKRYENEKSANDSTYWMLFELIWRDYFRFLSIKYGNAIFHIGGPRHLKGKAWSQDLALFEAWKNGCTGYPLIDANMRELNATGFMSNRGRQIVCSFLVRDMGIDWRLGAEWFETCLLDYDPCSNYGNWTYGAGVGNDPREDRYFSIPKQAQTYDPEGEYVSYWIPELSKLPPKARHFPGSCYIKPTVPLKFGEQSRTTKPGLFHKANTKGRRK